MTLVAQWNSFLWPLVVINSPAIKVLSVGLSDFRLFRNILWNQLMAAVMIGSFPMILILLAAQKYFIRGIQFSGVNR
jgi:multiple sugar transport system permease protein